MCGDVMKEVETQRKQEAIFRMLPRGKQTPGEPGTI
jgi:hypothetical protein